METQLLIFGYLFLRLAPFIIACFFTLASILNADYKGFIYLAGLVMSSVLVIMSSNPLFAIGDKIKDMMMGEVPNFLAPPTDRGPLCNEFSLITDTSLLPQGQSMLGFTFAYLLYPIIHNEVVISNLPTIIFFPILILFDLIWNAKNSCYSFGQLIVSLILGVVFGICWALIVSAKTMDSLYYTVGTPGQEVTKCSTPSKSTFKCDVYKGGKLLTSM